MEEKIIKQITEYVYTNYKSLKGKELVNREYDNCFHILTHKDSSPLILSKKIINN